MDLSSSLSVFLWLPASYLLLPWTVCLQGTSDIFDYFLTWFFQEWWESLLMIRLCVDYFQLGWLSDFPLYCWMGGGSIRTVFACILFKMSFRFLWISKTGIFSSEKNGRRLIEGIWEWKITTCIMELCNLTNFHIIDGFVDPYIETNPKCNLKYNFIDLKLLILTICLISTFNKF